MPSLCWEAPTKHPENCHTHTARAPEAAELAKGPEPECVCSSKGPLEPPKRLIKESQKIRFRV